MKSTACCIISGLIVAAFVSGIVLSAHADEGDEQSYYEESFYIGDLNSEDESGFYFESSSEDESSFYFESGNEDESSYYFESDNEDESSYYFESSNEDENSYYSESSSEDEISYYFESSDDDERSFEDSEYEIENSSTENSQSSTPDGTESSIPEEIVRVPYIPRNDPLGWLNGIDTVIPLDKNEHSGAVIENEESRNNEIINNYTVPDAEISSLSVTTVTRRVTSEDKGKDSKTAFLIGLIIFSLIGMIATMALIAFLRSKGMFAPSFLKFEPKKKTDKKL